MSATFDLILKNGKCFIDDQFKSIDIGISNGIIKSIGKIEETSNQKILNADDLIVLPGIIDTQVHFREPGATDSEDLNSGSDRPGGLGDMMYKSLWESPKGLS